MRVFYILIIVTALNALSAAAMETADDFFRPLEDGRVFQARHPNKADPYFSYNDHEVTISIGQTKQFSLWRPDINEDWFMHHKKEIILFFVMSLDGHKECIGYFWTALGGPISFREVPDAIVRESFKQLLNFEF